MAMTTKERTDLREELVSQGYSWDYIDEWQPKVTLYRHREMKNPKGEVVSEAGTKVEGLPGNPDYITRKARQGLLQWPPGDTCTCTWCQDKRKSSAPVSSEESTVSTQTYSIGRGKRRMMS
jgi:hypothetical protein